MTTKEKTEQSVSIESVLAILERQNEVLSKVAKVIHGKPLMAEVAQIGEQIKALSK